MDLNINYGNESYVIPEPTERVIFEGRAGKDGNDFDESVLAGFMTKEEALDKFALLESKIQINAEQILLTVSRTEFDLLGNQLSQLKTSIDQTAYSITLLASKSELNSVAGRLTQAEASLKITSDGLLLKANQSYVNDLNQRVISAEASLNVQANLIAAKVSKTEFDTFGNTIGQRFSTIEQRADSITSIVQGLPTKEYVDSKVGSNNVDQVLSTYNTRIQQLENLIQLTATKTTTDLLGQRLSAAEGQFSVLNNLIEARVTLDTFNSANQRLTTAEGKITVMADQIQSKVSQSTIDVVTGRLANAESSINQFNNQIQSRVSYTDYNGVTIASLINQSPSNVKILAKNIQLEGAVTATSLESGRTRINRNPEGDFEFLHGNGVVAFRMTTLSDGKAVFQAFNNGGEKIFDIDTVSQGGIQYVEAVPDKSVPVQINRIANFAGTQLNPTEENTLKNNAKAIFDYKLATYPGYARDVQEVRIDKLLSTNAYDITIGIYPNADPSTGGYHTGSTTNTPYVEDGWYVMDNQYVGVKYHPADYGTEPQYGLVTVFAVQNGKTLRQMNLSIQL